MRSFETSLPDLIVPGATISEAGHTRSFEDTDRWLRPLLRRVPITRVFDATPLDSIGAPVWSAVTPLARDLLVHAGKGSTPMAARVSAIMEAIERVSAETVAANRRCVDSFTALRSRSLETPPLDPREFNLPFATEYDADRPISWTVGWDLMTSRHVMVAADLAVSPAAEGVCIGVETNGLASGNTYTEAIVHALYEVIERDAVARTDFFDAFGEADDLGYESVRMVHLGTLRGAARTLCDSLRARGLDLQLRFLSHETEIPVFQARLLDASFPSGAKAFGGYGAGLDPIRAAVRAITEAAQAHTALLIGNRDEYETLGPRTNRPYRAVRRVSMNWPLAMWAFPDEPSTDSRDVLAELQALIQRLAACGISHCVVVDLTREDLRVPVVRVLIPEFTALYGFTSRRPSLRLLRALLWQ
jgi:YcaO-like protein with predicted kinase domain